MNKVKKVLNYEHFRNVHNYIDMIDSYQFLDIIGKKFPRRFKETAQISAIKEVAFKLPLNKVLFASSLKKWALSNDIFFKWKDVITERNFEDFSKATIRGCLGLEGYKKYDGEKSYFFVTSRNLETGDIFGFWSEWNEEAKNFLNPKLPETDSESESVKATKPEDILREVSAIVNSELPPSETLMRVRKILEEAKDILK